MRRLAILLLLVAPLAFAKGGAFRATKHGAGSCVQCHDLHAGHRRGAPAPGGNARCLDCHGLPSPAGIFPGAGAWQQSTHASSRGGRCIDCHDPHGVKDTNGVIPSMLKARQPDVCIACHDGARASDVRSELYLPYVHGKRIACADCHNAHANEALSNVARVEVLHGPRGTQPSYTLRDANDSTPVEEQEICFRCHSSYVKQKPGASDLARLFNPENPSMHPVGSAGQNRNIHPDAFVNGISADSTIRCTDCHANHGSMHAALLKKRVPLAMGGEPMTRTDLCFDCHSYRVYADPASDDHRFSRFDAHAMHVGAQRVPCASCHESHGSTRQIALIATNRGISSFMQTPNGGTCTPTCHSMKTYQVTYPR